jgi:hypothetical protein
MRSTAEVKAAELRLMWRTREQVFAGGEKKMLTPLCCGIVCAPGLQEPSAV